MPSTGWSWSSPFIACIATVTPMPARMRPSRPRTEDAFARTVPSLPHQRKRTSRRSDASARSATAAASIASAEAAGRVVATAMFYIPCARADNIRRRDRVGAAGLRAALEPHHPAAGRRAARVDQLLADRARAAREPETDRADAPVAAEVVVAVREPPHDLDRAAAGRDPRGDVVDARSDDLVVPQDARAVSGLVVSVGAALADLRRARDRGGRHGERGRRRDAADDQ